MSYYHDEDDPHAFDLLNAICADCGERWYRSEHDRCVWCGPCAQRRDAWATAQEIRSMAKAVLKVDLMKVRDIA